MSGSLRQDPSTTSLELSNVEAAVQPLTSSSYDDLSSEGQVEAPWKRFALKLFVSIVCFIGFSILLEHFAEESVTAASKRIMSWIGLPGLFVGVFIADGVPQPFTYVPLIFMAVKGFTPKPEVFCICAAGSYSAALVGYATGQHIRSTQCGNNFFNKLLADHPYVPELMRKRGALGVALAALMPVPLAIATWTAGSFSIHFPHFLLAGMCRLPKIAIFVLLSRTPQVHTPGPPLVDTVVDQ
mmetsp:Transcript_55198/g.124327  ORF Transcript_55198/g.124327 Transcript_55198/m.124327 type:complete len:241 (-) Transcript_55198:247-969(-)